MKHDLQADMRRQWVEAAQRARGDTEGQFTMDFASLVDLRCGARTRAGTPCKRRDLYDSRRCRLHGGLSTGPRTAAGKAISSQNARGRTELEVTATAGGQDAPACVTPSSPTPQPHFFELMMDRYLAGSVRWPRLERLLAVVDDSQRMTRAEVANAAGVVGAERLLDILLARGILVERPRGQRLVVTTNDPA